MTDMVERERRWVQRVMFAATHEKPRDPPMTLFLIEQMRRVEAAMREDKP